MELIKAAMQKQAREEPASATMEEEFMRSECSRYNDDSELQIDTSAFHKTSLDESFSQMSVVQAPNVVFGKMDQH